MVETKARISAHASALILHSLRLMALQHDLLGLRHDSKKAVTQILLISFAASLLRFFSPLEPILQTIFLLMVIRLSSVRVGMALALLSAGIDVFAVPLTMVVGDDGFLLWWEMAGTIAVLIRNRKWVKYDEQNPRKHG